MDERREHTRQPQPPLHVRANGNLFQSHEWSEGNLLLEADGAYTIGALISIDAVGLSKKRLQDIGIRGRVARVTDEGAAAIDFLHRDDQAASVLRELVDGV